MHALNELLREGGFGIEPVVRVETQVPFEDGTRPDMTGYDEHGVKRLIVESKFWAGLMERQASGYASQFDYGGPAVLIFICPEARRQTIWLRLSDRWQNSADWKTSTLPQECSGPGLSGKNRASRNCT